MMGPPWPGRATLARFPPVSAAVMGNSTGAPEKSAALRVLIVDDEPLIRWSMTETLIAEGHSVVEAGNAKEAILRVSGQPAPDVILLDLYLPDSVDLNLLESIRRAAPRSAIVMMTAYGNPEVAAGAIRLGAYRVVNKPLEMGDLATLIQEADSSRR